MAGYDDTRNKILESLLQRPVGTEINPENHQDFALSLLDYIRSVELISGSTLIGIAYQDTVPVQSNDSNGVYIAGVAQGSTVVFQNFRDVNGNQLTVTTEDTESKLVILIWNRQYWSKHEISANVVSQAENAYYNLTIRKQYESVYAMNSDKKSPIGNDGRAIRRGEIVSVRNLSNSNENGLYSYELDEHKIPYWQLQTKLSTLADRIIDGGGASGRLDLIQNRRDTNENWEEQNPVLAEGEIGFVVDQNYYKIGDGVSSWKNLQRIGYYDVDINKWLEYDRKNIYSLQEGAGCLQFDGFTEVTGLGGIFNTKDSYRYKVLYSTTSKSFILSVVDELDGITKKVGNFLFWPEIKLEVKTIPSSESYKRRDVLFYIFTPNVGSVYYYIDDDGNASEKSSTYIIKKQLDSVKNSIIKKATVEYYDHSVTDGPDRINTRANIKFLDANDNQLFNAVLFGAGNGYPGLLSLKNKTKLDNYADTFVTNPVASSESNGLMSADDKSKLDGVDEVIDLPWNDDVNGQDGYVNNFTERGEYHIHGERLYANDGLPILNAASGHTIDGLMTVLDSSLPNGNKYDVCVTQILRLNNRVGGDGHIFIRTGIAATKAELQKPTAGGWSTWEKLMGVFEKNAVSNATDLDKYTSSGMYDGMFVFSSASQVFSGLRIESGSTFLMVVVNGYAVASAGVVPQVTQLLYLMPSGLDGSSGVRNAEVYTRTGIYVASTKTYTWGKFDGLAHASDIAKILGYLRETYNLAQENQSSILEIQNNISRIDERGLCDVYFIQERDGSLSITKLGLDDRANKLEFPLATTTAAGAMSSSDKIKLEGHVELGAFDTFTALFARAAKFDIVSNNAIALLHGTYRQAEGIYHGVLILQQVEKNNAGGGTAMQYIYIEKRQYTRYINFSATAVTEVQGVQNHGARNLSLSNRVLKLKNMWGKDVGSSVTLPDNGNLREGNADAASVPVVLAKTFGGTATAILGAATTARAGVMTVDHVNKIKELGERVLQYLYPKIYKINEGAGARQFDGFYAGSASVSAERKTAATEGCSYKVVFYLGKFHLQEISPEGDTISLYSKWDKIGDIASSESYAERDKLYYIYEEGEGSTYYYIDGEGNAVESSATYLLRRLIDALGSNLATAKSELEAKDAAAVKRIDALENPPSPDYVEMMIEADITRHYKLFYDVRCISWLEIDGEEIELPVITENRAAQYYATLSQGRHVVRFKPKEGNMSDGTPWKEREGMLAWCDGSNITEVTLPEGWTVVNSKMFERAESLRRVNLPSTITEVRFGAFGNCTALEEIVLPPSVTTINHVMAHDCPALKRIVLGGRNISASGTLAQNCAALECVEFRAGGTVSFTSSNNTFINLPQLARFIVKGNLPTFECSQPFTSTGYVGSSVEADNRWLFTSDGERPYETKWSSDLMRLCNFTVKKLFSYTLA